MFLDHGWSPCSFWHPIQINGTSPSSPILQKQKTWLTNWYQLYFLYWRVHLCNKNRTQRLWNKKITTWFNETFWLWRVHLCKVAGFKTAADAVTLGVTGMCCPPVAPVIRVIFTPLFLAVPLVGFIIRIGFELLTLPESFSGALTGFFAAVTLVFDTWVGDKKLMTMSASNGFHGFSLPPLWEKP